MIELTYAEIQERLEIYNHGIKDGGKEVKLLNKVIDRIHKPTYFRVLYSLYCQNKDKFVDPLKLKVKFWDHDTIVFCQPGRSLKSYFKMTLKINEILGPFKEFKEAIKKIERDENG